MLRLISLVAILVCAQAVDDFFSEDFNYEFIYHKTHNLLLTVHDNSCYFSHVPNDENATQYLMVDHKEITEFFIIHQITYKTDKVHQSDLASVRDTFSDLLADYTCEYKSIHTLDFDYGAVKHYADQFHGDNGGHHSGWLFGDDD